MCSLFDFCLACFTCGFILVLSVVLLTSSVHHLKPFAMDITIICYPIKHQVIIF